MRIDFGDKLTVGNRDYDIIMVDEDHERYKEMIELGAVGLCCPTSEKILILMPNDSDIEEEMMNVKSDTVFNESLLHELTHAIFYETSDNDLYEDEALVERVSKVLCGIFKRNNLKIVRCENNELWWWDVK